MQKNYTKQKGTVIISEKKRLENLQELQPKGDTLKKIIQFASSYRVEQIIENQYVEWYLN